MGAIRESTRQIRLHELPHSRCTPESHKKAVVFDVYLEDEELVGVKLRTSGIKHESYLRSGGATKQYLRLSHPK